MEAERHAIYRPRRPRATALWQCVNRHLSELRASGRLRRAVEENVLERFLECGDLHCGFARIRCGGCGHDLLLAFSCKTRYFCPSCHQKRVVALETRRYRAHFAARARRKFLSLAVDTSCFEGETFHTCGLLARRRFAVMDG